jgi:hypothetical protein
MNMVFTPIDSSIKEKIISLHLSGSGRNQIDRLLREQGVKVSHGTISNVINAYRQRVKNEQSSQLVNRLQPSQNSTMQAVNPEADLNSSSAEPIINIPDDQEIDFDNIPYHPALDGESGERLLGYTLEPEQVDISDRYSEVGRVDISDTQYDNVVEKASQVKEPTTEKQPSQSEDTSLDLGIDYESIRQARFIKRVVAERHNLSIARQNLEREKILLERDKQNFSEAEDDLAQRIYQVKDLLPLADEMKRLGLDFSVANSFLICVKEMAQSRGLTEKEAAWKLADMLKSFEYLGGFETSIKSAKHQLELLNYAIEEKKQAIATLVDLRKKGIYEREIAQVVETIKSKSNGHGRREIRFTSISKQ